MNSSQMKAAILSYWRYSQQAPIVALESNPLLKSFNMGGQADVMAVTANRQLVIIEIKVDIDDLRRDFKKPLHEKLKAALLGDLPLFGKGSQSPAHKFYFAVPVEIARDASRIIEERYPYAGLLAVRSHYFCITPDVMVYRQAVKLPRPKVSLLELARMSREQSATICRLLFKVNELEERLRIT